MRIRYSISTNIVGSECNDEFEIPDAVFEGLDAAERDGVIESYARDAAFSEIDWHWEIVE